MYLNKVHGEPFKKHENSIIKFPMVKYGGNTIVSEYVYLSVIMMHSNKESFVFQ